MYLHSNQNNENRNRNNTDEQQRNFLVDYRYIHGHEIKSWQLFFFCKIDKLWRNMEIYKCKWMVLDALGCMNNAEFGEKKKKVNDILHIVSIFWLQWVQVTHTSIQFYRWWRSSFKVLWISVFLCLFLPITQAVSIPFCTTLDLQLSFCSVL